MECSPASAVVTQDGHVKPPRPALTWQTRGQELMFAGLYRVAHPMLRIAFPRLKLTLRSPRAGTQFGPRDLALVKTREMVNGS